MYYDDSIRLEPTQVAGFTTAYRSLVPESVAGLVPGTRFQTTGIGIDHAFTNGFYTGAEIRWLNSDGERTVGAASNSLPIPLPDTPTSTPQTLSSREQAVTAYAGWLLYRDWSAGVQYQLTQADLETRFPDLPDSADGLDDLEQNLTAQLHTVRLYLHFNHPSGWFAQWHSDWTQQQTDGASPASESERFWQHHLFAGYRFPRRRAEIRLGILNLTDTDHRLHPLTLDGNRTRERTFTASLRLNF